MLKFKFSLPNVSVDSKIIDITDVTFIDSSRYEIVDEVNGIVNKFDDEKLVIFSATNVYGMQPDSHVYGSNKIVVSNEDGTTINEYDYFEDLIVENVSNVDKTFTIRIKDKLKLDLQNIFIETRFHSIVFEESNWVIREVSKEWLTNNEIPSENLITIDKVVYGKNLRQVPFEGENYDDYQVFYYENNAWKTLNLIGKDNMEGCLKGSNITFESFHEYDEKLHPSIELDRNKSYYTKEVYIYFDCYPSHYFTNPKENVESDVDEESGFDITKVTDYGKEVIKKIEYPIVYFSYRSIEGVKIVQKEIPIECHIENDSRLCFNYNNLTEENAKLFEAKLFPDGIELDKDEDIVGQEGYNGGFIVSRNNILYNNDYVTFKIIYDTSLNVVQIPLSQSFETDMYHNDALNTHFVEVEKANAINPIMDLEKDVYIPVIFSGKKEKGEYMHMNSDYIDCYNIIFNLHFREHRDNINGEQWKCKNESYWNGTRVLTKEYDVTDEYEGITEKETKKIVDLKGRIYKYPNEDETKKYKYDYFSYFGSTPTVTETDKRKTDGFDNPNESESNDYNINNPKEYAKLRKDRNQLMEYQSDLLSYLGFSNDDVKYQKNKLKKSFLRISFYDSDNIANQNLLHTSTIFLDSGELFAKYIKNIDTEDTYKVKQQINDTKNNITYKEGEIIEGKVYRKLSSDLQKKCVINGEVCAVIGTSAIESDVNTVYDKNGVRVNREPMRSKPIEDGDLSDNMSDLERLRLSSQIQVTDKYSSNRSSEGFYFYTYKNNDNGVFPSDIYMRVEFNHAGYGRTIPFMMPYIRKNEEKLQTGQAGYKRYTELKRENKIKTFDDICYDWSEIDFDKFDEDKFQFPLKDEEEVGYGTVRYIKYAYIKWKYRYDKRTQKHVYYLDPDVYGNGVTTDNKHGNNIILNLYEGKIR